VIPDARQDATVQQLASGQGAAFQAFFVRCGRTTMTQNELDDGRRVCLIGVARLPPAELVIFRIGQWTSAALS
jgi:phage tail sheath protein FI